jgi:glycerophosphoryl diester phosphodiesterase
VPELPDLKPALRRVGHKGAAHIAPGNSLASFDAAVAHGVDMIEFDVLPEDYDNPATSRLVLAHDYTADLASAPTLDEGLAHLAATGLELDVDLKLPGYEDRVLDALRAHDLIGRSLISTMEEESLRRVRELEPGVRLGWSVPKLRRDYTLSPIYRYPAYAALLYARRVLPGRAAEAIRSGRVDALMSHWKLVTPRMVDAVRGAGGDLYVWTVDEAPVIRWLERLGVTGVITNDPRLFN